MTTTDKQAKQQKVVDWELSLRLASDNVQLAQELLDMYAEALPKFRHDIKRNASIKNYDALYGHAHKLHGSSSFCGVPHIREAAKQLEIALKSKEVLKTELSALVKKVLDSIDDVIASYHVGNYKS